MLPKAFVPMLTLYGIVTLVKPDDINGFPMLVTLFGITKLVIGALYITTSLILCNDFPKSNDTRLLQL